MEYGEYYLIRPSELKKLSKLKAETRAILGKLGKLADKKERWALLPISDDKITKVADLVLHFNNYEHSAWDFDVHVKGKCILSVCFGENDEAGIDESMNGIDGNVAKAAEALDVDPKKFSKALESEDMEKLAKLVGFPILPITPSDIEHAGEYDE